MIRPGSWQSYVLFDPLSLIIGGISSLAASPGAAALAGGALAGGGALASSLIGGSKAPNISMPGTPPPSQSPTGTASTFKANQPSFLSAAAASPQQQNVAQKSLLGQ